MNLILLLNPVSELTQVLGLKIGAVNDLIVSAQIGKEPEIEKAIMYKAKCFVG